MTELNILVSSAGRRVELIQCFRDALRNVGIRGAVCAADCSPDAPALQLADKAWQVSKCHNVEFISELLELVSREDIHVIVPTIDAELTPLSAYRRAFADRDTYLCISALETVQISVDKAATHDWLVANDFPTVAQSLPQDVLANPAGWTYPLIVKPRFGSASKGVRIVKTAYELGLYAEQDEHLIVQTIAEGVEYTLNVFVDRAGKCVCAVPHERLELRAGEVSKALTVKKPELMTLARRVSERLPGARGPLNIQCFVSPQGDIKIIEINARFGGGYPLTHRAGGQFTRWILEEELRLPPSWSFDDWTDDLAMLRYDQAVFQPGHEIRSTKPLSPVVSGIRSGRYAVSGAGLHSERF